MMIVDLGISIIMDEDDLYTTMIVAGDEVVLFSSGQTSGEAIDMVIKRLIEIKIG